MYFDRVHLRKATVCPVTINRCPAGHFAAKTDTLLQRCEFVAALRGAIVCVVFDTRVITLAYRCNATTWHILIIIIIILEGKG